MRPRIYPRHQAIDSLAFGFAPAAYAVELSCGLVKVGHSHCPRGRLQALSNAVRRNLQATITRVHVGPLMPRSARGVEWEVLRRLRAIACPVHGREFFAGVAFEDAARLIDEASAAEINAPREAA